LSLSLRDAWLVLGREPRRIAEVIRSRADRVAAAEELLASARGLARRLLGLHHPDKNPGDREAPERFALVQEALSVVEAGTEEFRSQTEDRALARDGSVFIEVEKP
jgi:hypothetical protein